MFSLSKPKRPSAATVAPPIPPPTRSNQVRNLWSQFEGWHAAQLGEIEGEIEAKLRELDQKHRSTQTPTQKKPRKGKKDPVIPPVNLKELEEEKTKIRLELEKTLSGNVVRQEWDKRLGEAGLQSDDWIDITEEEQRKVESILGADLEEEPEPEPESPPRFYMVDPNSFHTLDDAWLEVKPNADEDTSSSEAWSTPASSAYAYASWSSEASVSAQASRSSAQSSQSSSPEWHSTKHLASDASSSTSSSRPTRSSRYVGPHLTSDSSDSDLESSFEKYKLTIRIQKIREFHSEAAEADIQLTVDLDESRRAKLWSKDGEAARVRSHEASMLELRERKEAERKNEVDLERRRRRAELALAHQPKDPESSFLKNNLSNFVSASDTPTIRNSQSAFIRSHLSAHDWAGPESGNDTPTPTAKPSGWSIKNKKEVASSSSSGLLGAFGEAPPLKRFATAPTVAKSSLWEDAAAKKSEVPSKPSSVAAAAPIPAPSVASSNKKSKKEKANASAGVGKSLSFSMEEENIDATNANVLATSSSSLSASIGMGMPGQWGWGEEQFDYHPAMSSSLGFGEASTSASALVSSMNATTQPAPKLQLPDNRRVWLPPAALEANLNQNHKTSAAQVQKSVSALGSSSHSQTLDIPLPVQKSVSGPPEFEGGGFGRPAASKISSAPPVVASASKAGSSSLPAPTPVPVPAPSSTTPASKKKSSSASLTSNSSKGKKPQPQSQPPPQKPKVTIEEVSDSDSDSDSESESESVLELARKAKGKGIEKLPPDSRYIIEDAPPPVPKATAAVETKGKGKGKSAANPTATATTTTTKSEPMLAPAPKAAQTPKSSGPSSVPKSNTNTKQKSKSNTTAPVVEPKPVVPQEMFREIFEFGDESANGEALTSSTLSSNSSQPQQYDVWKPPSSSSSSYTSLPSTSTSSYPSSHPTTMTNDHNRWIPTGAGRNGNGVGETADKQKRVHWTSHSNAYAHDEPQSDAFGNSGTQDVFLSALDSLEAIVRGESGAVGGNGTGETSRLGPGGLSTNGGAGGPGTNAGAAVGKRPRVTNNELNANANTNTNLNKKRGGAPNTDDNFWQHAITSLGRGVSTSAM